MRARHTHNADGKGSLALAAGNLEPAPTSVGKAHSRRHMFHRHHKGRGKEPGGATDPEQAGVRLPFLTVEDPGDAHCRTNEQGRINASRLGTRVLRTQEESGYEPQTQHAVPRLRHDSTTQSLSGRGG